MLQFTVTRVDEEDGEVGQASDPLCCEGGAVSSPLTGSGTVTLQLPDSGTSDAESSYGDTLTQTSITKLLSKKFKVSMFSFNTFNWIQSF